MDNIKNFFKFLKDNDIIMKYQIVFNRVLSYEELLAINEEDINKIISGSQIDAVIKLYEVINSIEVNQNIKEYILSLDSDEKIKYCLRLAVFDNFDNDLDKMNYVKALNESNEDVVKYAYNIAMSPLYKDTTDRIDYIKMIGKSKEECILSALDILYNPIYRKDEDLYEFMELVSLAKEDYIVEYMKYLFIEKERIPMSYIRTLLCSKGSKQAYYTYKILNDEKALKKDNIDVIAMLIATCEDENLKNKYETLIYDLNMEDEYPAYKAYDIINSKVKVKICKDIC